MMYPRNKTKLVRQALQFSCGVQPIFVGEDRPDWSAFARRWLRQQGIGEGVTLLTQGPSNQNPSGNHRMEMLDLNPGSLYQCYTPSGQM